MYNTNKISGILFDMDGNKLIDYYLGMGPMILGYNPTSIREAVKKGFSFMNKDELPPLP